MHMTATSSTNDPNARAYLESNFESPPPHLKSRPLWFWNGILHRERTREIMEQSAASGYGGYGILPALEMEPAFMSKAFLEHYRFCPARMWRCPWISGYMEGTAPLFIK